MAHDRDDPPPGGGGPLRVLLLELDGGGAGALLVADAGLHVLTARAMSQLPLLIARFAPHVLVVAVERPTLELATGLRSLQLGSRVPVLVVSREAEDPCVTEFLKAGASGYLLGEDARRAPQAVREMVEGGAPMSAGVSRLVLSRARRSSAKMPAVVIPITTTAPALTPRQREVVELLASGHNYEDIGRALDVSVNTVRTHVRAVYERLGASTRVEAVMAAIQLGLIRGR